MSSNNAHNVPGVDSSPGKGLVLFLLVAAGMVLAGRVCPLGAASKPPAGVVSGRVITAFDGVPVAWALISIARVPADTAGCGAPPVLQAITGRDGRFVLGGLETGDYQVRAGHIAFVAPAAICVHVDSVPRAVDFVLTQRIHVQAPVVVRATRPRPGPLTRLHRRLGSADVRRRGGALDDPVRAISSTPGVSSRGDYDGRLRIRGGGAAETHYLLDGLPVPGAFHLGGLASVFDPETIDRIDIYAGTPPVWMTAATSGVVSVRTTDVVGRADGGGVNLSPLAAGGVYGASMFRGRAGVLASIRGTYHDLLMRAVGGDDQTTIPNFYDARVAAEIRSGERHRFALTLLRSRDEMRLDLGSVGGDTGATIRTSSTWMRYAARWDGNWAEGRATASAHVAVQPAESDLRLEGRGREAMDWRSNDARTAFDAGLTSERHSIRAGIEASRRRLGYDFDIARGFLELWAGGHGEASLASDPATIRLRGSRPAGALAGYIDETWHAHSAWRVSAGARATRFDGDDDVSIDPRVGVEWGSETFGAFVAAGRYHDLTGTTTGDPAVAAEASRSAASDQGALGFHWISERWGEVGVEGFSRSTRGLPAENKPGEFAMVALERTRGLEATWRRRLAGCEFEAFYSFARTYRHNPYGRLVKAASPAVGGNLGADLVHAHSGWTPSPNDPGRGAGVHAAIALVSGLRVDARWQYRSGGRYTPVDRVVRDGRGVAFGIEGAPYSKRLPAYHRLDVRLEHKRPTRWGDWVLYVEVDNVYNRRNVFQSMWDTAYERTEALRMLPILPVLGVEANW